MRHAKMWVTAVACAVAFAMCATNLSAQIYTGPTLRGNKALSGSNTHAGTGTFNGAANFSAAVPASESSNGAINAASPLFTGANLCANVNQAIVSVGTSGATIEIPAGSYNCGTTTITKPRYINLRGQGAGSTQITWSSSVAAAVVVGDTGSGSLYTTGEISDVTLIGSGASGIGVFFGGDPAGVLNSSSAYGESQSLHRVVIHSFATAIETGNNTWNDTFDTSLFWGNTTALLSAPGSTNSGEGIAFVDSNIFNNPYIMQNVNYPQPVKLLRTHLDYNGNATATKLGTYAPILNSWVECTMCYTEMYTGPLATGSFVYSGGQIFLTSGASLTDPAIFPVTQYQATNILKYTEIRSWHTLSAVLTNTGGGGYISVEDLYGNPLKNITAVIGTNNSNTTHFSGMMWGAAPLYDKFSVDNISLTDGDGSGYAGLFVSSAENGIKITPHGNRVAYWTDSLLNISQFALKISAIENSSAGLMVTSTQTGGLLSNCGTMTTTAAASNVLSCAWVTASSACMVTPTNASGVAWTYLTPSAGSVTVYHAAMAGQTYSVACSAD